MRLDYSFPYLNRLVQLTLEKISLGDKAGSDAASKLAERSLRILARLSNISYSSPSEAISMLQAQRVISASDAENFKTLLDKNSAYSELSERVYSLASVFERRTASHSTDSYSRIANGSSTDASSVNLPVSILLSILLTMLTWIWELASAIIEFLISYAVWILPSSLIILIFVYLFG